MFLQLSKVLLFFTLHMVPNKHNKATFQTLFFSFFQRRTHTNSEEPLQPKIASPTIHQKEHKSTTIKCVLSNNEGEYGCYFFFSFAHVPSIRNPSTPHFVLIQNQNPSSSCLPSKETNSRWHLRILYCAIREWLCSPIC